MLIDARELPQDYSIAGDICVVGAGAAGITLALELADTNLQVCLLEGGGENYSKPSQQIYEGDITGLPYTPLHEARLRYLGGTSNHWGGWCRPLDPLDFEKRDWVPYSGWPFDRTHLEPYYQRAAEWCQIGPSRYEPQFWQTAQTPPLPFSGDDVRSTLFQYSPPTRFGIAYGDRLRAASNVRVYLNASVVDIETSAAGSEVTALRIATPDGQTLRATSRYFVLAAGGIENTRILLNANSRHATGIGNQHDLVGRFFQDHAGLNSGTMMLSDPRTSVAFYTRHTVEAGAAQAPDQRDIRGALTFSTETLRQHRMSNIGLLIKDTDWAHAFGIKPAVKAALIGEGDYFWRYLGAAAANFDDVGVRAYRSVVAPESKRKLAEFVSIIEPLPDPQSRVKLGSERDAFGNLRVELNWRLSTPDKRTIWQAQQLLAMALGASGLGRMLVALDENDTTWPPLLDSGFWEHRELGHGWHHMGTTRMHDDPRQGVVDADCRIHGLANLLVAGSSVFPTYGFSQPTLTIVALAVRLAEHLRRLIT